MSRLSLALVIVLAGFLAPSSALAEGEFRKQIVVYLDSSGSMLPRSSNPGDPFQKTLEALQLFLGEPGFVTAADSITVATFGGQIESRTRWTGASNPSLELQAIPRASNAETDLGAVFDHLVKELDKNADRRLVIIASDFIQEPRARGASPGSSLASWNELARSRLPRLQQLFGKDPKQRLLLLRAPARGDRQEFLSIRDRIVDEIAKATAADTFDIGAGGLRADELARQIRKKLLYDLEVEARYDADGHRIQVTVTNPNGQGLELEETLRVTCLDEQGRDLGDSASIPVPREEASLGASGTEASARALPPLSVRLDCLVKAAKYRVDVVTREGAEGRVSVLTDSWIVHRVDEAQMESRLFQRAFIRLRLYLRGQGERFRIAVYAEDDARSPLATANFESPPELDPFEEHLFHFALPVLGGTSRNLPDKNSIRVEIGDEGSEGIVSRDEAASWANRIQEGAGLVLSGLLVALFVTRRRDVEAKISALAALQELQKPALGAFAALVSGMLHLAQLQLVPRLADWSRFLILLVVVPLTVFLIARTFLGYRLAQRLRNPDPDLTSEQLLALIRATGPATFLALLTFAGVVLIFVLNASVPIESTAAIPVAVTKN